MVIIDDDPNFLDVMATAAAYEGIDAETFSSLDEMGTLARLGDYDLAVLDYSLSSMTGIEIAEYIDIFFDRLPVILVSASDSALRVEDHWPDCIRDFKPKAEGVPSIIGSAKDVLENRAVSGG
jgi:DNA-binding response OmpR family regulator